MKKLSILCYLCFLLAACSQSTELAFEGFMELTVINTLNQVRTDQLIWVKQTVLEDRLELINPNGFTVYVGNVELVSQYVNTGHERGLAILIPQIRFKEEIRVQITYDPDREEARFYPKRTQAELSHKMGGYFENRKYIGGEFENVEELHVPAEHTDHSWYIRYEGPGWESDQVGYRFYLDWRNGVDVFGKTVKEPILQLVGQDGFDSYHELQDWGMDVLKVAKSLGVGSIATFENNAARRVDETDSLYAAITNNGVIYSSILTKYHGWNLESGKTTLTSNLSIHAGTRLSQQHLQSSKPIPNIATGLIKDNKAELLIGAEDKEYGYLATYGKQSLNEDNLGIVIFFRNDQKVSITEDEFSHVVVLQPTDQEVKYYFAAAWELEPDGIKTKEEFVAYLERVTDELSNPLVVEIKK
ncbi:DUF4861 domain-containing protein [Belliella pelovolcani]|uniref:DUF4861 domain-containing protein n=1 Tax=Belliella pelovolcani TaxID=529505 RepID=A0A1N7MUH1_9BACT|nr:DUF4861 domain-containing protein [Belliella pelovolcani]SIS89777.1 protein of unknown function [Belliella pelovolcani]